MALRMVEPVEVALHPATAALTGMLADLAEQTADALGGVDDHSSQVDVVDQLALLGRLRGAVAAVQAATMVRLARARVEAEQARGRREEWSGRGLARTSGWRRHDLIREQPGWSATVVHDGVRDQPGIVQTTTPTGHRHAAGRRTHPEGGGRGRPAQRNRAPGGDVRADDRVPAGRAPAREQEEPWRCHRWSNPRTS